MPWVYSTATNDTQYREYGPPRKSAPPVVKRKVLIKGGANRPAFRTLVTPYGVGTEVTEEELAFLESNKSFQRHKDAGYVSVTAKKVDPERPAANMEKRDGAAPFVEADFTKAAGGKGKGPKVGKITNPFE